MSRLRLALMLMGVCSLALGLIGPASAGARTQSKYGGTLVVGLSGGDPDASTRRSAADFGESWSTGRSASGSTTTTPSSQLVPVLAAALPVLSKDKLSYTIQLRQGIEFNDGTPFNAQAVVTTVQRYMTYPGSAAGQRLRLRRQRHRVRAVHRRLPPEGAGLAVHRRQRRTSSRRRSWPSSATTSRANPVCVGPFMFDHRVVGDNVTVIKSPYYYDQKDVYLDKIVFKPMPDAAAAAAALKAGDIQVLDRVSTTELPGVAADTRACG